LGRPSVRYVLIQFIGGADPDLKQVRAKSRWLIGAPPQLLDLHGVHG